MRESRGRYSAIAFGVACLVAGSMFTASAVASTETYFNLSAPAAQGYRFSLNGEVNPGSAPRPALASFGTRDDSVFTFYGARKAARTTRSRIHARLPGLGRVSVRFDERRRKDSTIRIGHGCRLVMVRRIGVFRGDLDMHGDGGYAGVDRKRAAGAYERTGFKGCGGHSRPAVPQSAARPRPELEAILTSCGPGPGVAFAGFASSRASGFAASSSERDHRLLILRYVSATAKGRAMRYSPQLKRARVIPPGPYFDGSARFASGALRGDLTASFIGADDVPLTPGDARLKSADRLERPPRCLPLFLGDRALPGAPIPEFGAPAAPARELANLANLVPGLPTR